MDEESKTNVEADNNQEKARVKCQVERLVSWVETLVGMVIYQFQLIPHRPRLFWNKLWVRKDEFHQSTDMDIDAMMVMNNEDRKSYISDLCRRRQIAHDRDLNS